MSLSFKVQPDRAAYGETLLLTAIDIIKGGFGIQEGTVLLVCGDGSEHELTIASWLPFGVEATLPSAAPGPEPYEIRVRTAAPLDAESAAPIEITS